LWKIPSPKKKTKDESGKEVEVPVTDSHGQVLLLHGDKSVRFEQPPFPLYDGEKSTKVEPLKLIPKNSALRLRALRDFEDRYSKGKTRRAGEEWLWHGLDTYYPQVEVEITATIKAVILKSDEALRLKARNNCVDYQGKERKAGEEWLVKMEGSYLPNVNEEVVATVKAFVLTYNSALHVRALSNFVDSHGVERKAGTEWLVTNQQTELYIPDTHEEVTNQQVALIVLGSHNYCIIKDPVDENDKPRLGVHEIVQGHKSFFLKPGESLEGGIQKSIILGPDEGLWITAKEEFTDTYKNSRIKRRPGHVWLIYGPGEYFNPIEAQVQTRAKSFLSIESLGIYFFQPALFVGSIFGLLLLLLVWLMYF